jgi:hypothetical protein
MKIHCQNPYIASYWTVATALVLLAGLFLRLMFYNGPFGSDDLRYYFFAEELFQGHGLRELDHAASRLVLLVFTGFPGVIGGNYLFSGLANIVYACLTDILVVLFVRRELGSWPAFNAACFLAFAGSTMVYAGTFLPEQLLSLLMFASVLMVYRWTGFGNLWRLVSGGVLAGLAYSVKDTAVLLMPPVILYLIFFVGERSLIGRISACVAYVSGFVAVWLLESAFYSLVAGNFFYKFQAIRDVHNASIVPAESLYEFVRGAWWNASEIFSSWDQLLFPLIFAVPAWFIVLFGGKRFRLFAMCGLFVFIYLIIGTSSFTQLINLPFQERYIQPILPFAAVCIAYVLSRTSFSLQQSIILISVAGIFLAVGCYGAIKRSGALYFTEMLRTAAIAVQLLPDDSEKVFVDLRLARGLQQILPRNAFARVHVLRAGEGRRGYYVSFRDRTTNVQGASSASMLRQDSAAVLVMTLELGQRNIARYYPLHHEPKFSIQVFFQSNGE